MTKFTLIDGRAELTVEHPASSYEVPVLVIDGEVYGRADAIHSEMSAAAWVADHAYRFGLLTPLIDKFIGRQVKTWDDVLAIHAAYPIAARPMPEWSF